MDSKMMFELSCISLCALLSVAVSWTRSPFMSLMYTILLFINSSILMLALGYEFLALVNLLVYVGALAVLFLFVIMLLNIPTTELRAYARGLSSLAFALFILVSLLGRSGYAFSSPLFPFGLGCRSANALGTGSLTCEPFAFIPAMESISSLGEVLYIYYADVLILNSMVLTIALIGALVLAHIRSA